eukprot:4230542-Pleurochrysis_carterae.AAC.6
MKNKSKVPTHVRRFMASFNALLNRRTDPPDTRSARCTATTRTSSCLPSSQNSSPTAEYTTPPAHR